MTQIFNIKAEIRQEDRWSQARWLDIFWTWQKCKVQVREMLTSLLIPKINYLFDISNENLEQLLEPTIHNSAPGWSREKERGEKWGMGGIKLIFPKAKFCLSQLVIVIAQRIDLPVGVSTHKLFNLIFFPCAVEEGSERTTGWGSG